MMENQAAINALMSIANAVVAAGGNRTAAGAPVIGDFTRDTSLASGLQAITGLGFTPSRIIILASVAHTPEVSFGFSDGTKNYSVLNFHNSIANSWDANFCVVYLQQTGASYSAVINSMDADGFTLSWTKGGAKTGIAACFYLAFR